MSDNSIQKGDYVICLAVFIQPVLVLLQHVLIDVFGMDPDATTNYRVVLTAIPMLAAIIIGGRRKFIRFLFVYLVVVLFLLLTIAIFPMNERYVRYEGVRFLLPLIIPSALCLTTVNSIAVIKRSLQIMAWLGAFLVLFYIIAYFSGVFVIDSYNMSFSYGCLLPMVVLYSQRTIPSMIVSFIMFITVLAIGSRGGAVIFIGYVLVEAFFNKRKSRWIYILLGLFIVLSIPVLMSFFDSIGISSRTMYLLNSGNITYDSGREGIYKFCIDELLNRPFLGVGLFGDRVLLGGAYCHNCILEICMDFGLLLGFIIVLTVFLIFVKSFFNFKGEIRGLLLILTFACFLPYLISGSYLVSNNIAIWLGYMILVLSKKMEAVQKVS